MEGVSAPILGAETGFRLVPGEFKSPVMRVFSVLVVIAHARSCVPADWLFCAADIMRRVPVFADEFNEFSVGHETLRHSHSPRFGVSLGVIHRYIDFERAEIGPPETLGDGSCFGERAAANIEPLRWHVDKT